MAEALNEHPGEDAPGVVPHPGSDLVEDPSPPARERLPELRAEEVSGEVDRPRRGGPPMPPSTFAPRFRALTGALVGLALGALAATLVLATGHGPQSHPGPKWSDWKPDQGGSKGAAQIAQHVGPGYRLPTGDELVLVTGGPLKVAQLDLPVRIAISSGGSTGSISEAKGKSVLYTLCGLGSHCAINKGKPSTERFLLLRREALELALYSFRYLGGIDNVVTLLPPSPGKKPKNALFFRRNELKPALDQPLRATLPAPPPTLDTLATSPEGSLVQRLTGGNLFHYSFTQSQDLSAFLVLNKLAG
jgi:hypothetical protein